MLNYITWLFEDLTKCAKTYILSIIGGLIAKNETGFVLIQAQFVGKVTKHYTHELHWYYAHIVHCSFPKEKSLSTLFV